MRDNLPWVRKADLAGKRVLVGGDLDVDDGDNPRINSVREIVRWLVEKKVAKVKVIGHRETKFPVCDQLRQEFPGVEFFDQVREDPGEKANDEEYAKKLADGWDVFVNEVFSTSHRKYASIVALPQVMKQQGIEVYLGLRFEKEVEMLSGVWSKPGKRVLVIGGVKVEDKSNFALSMADKFEWILTGGKIPEYLNSKLKAQNSKQIQRLKIPNLRDDGLDISEETISEYVEIISQAEVILAAGVMGKYEDPGAEKGTKMVLKAIAGNEKAYKVAGGGDIEMAISRYGLTEKFNWISVGGGAMLVYLGTGTLPGILAVQV